MLYDQSDMSKGTKELKKQTLISCAIFLVGLVISIAGLIIRNKLATILGVTVFAVIAFFWYDMKAMPYRKYVRFLSEIQTGRSHEANGTVSEISTEVRRSEEGVAIRDVNVTSSDGDTALFYWDDAKTMPEMINKNVRITSYGRYITGIIVD